MQIRFHFRIFPLLVALSLIVTGIALAQWQSGRAAEKEAIFSAMQRAAEAPARSYVVAQTSQTPAAYSRIKLRGEFLPALNIYLDNRPLGAQAGYQILSPFRLHQSDLYVMVLRGWHSRDPHDRKAIYTLPEVAGDLEIQGMVLPHLQRVMQLGEDGPVKSGELRQNLDLSKFAQETGLKMLPFILAQENSASLGLRTVSVIPENQADKHRAYAFQWYGLSLMTLLFYLVTGIRRASSSSPDPT